MKKIVWFFGWMTYCLCTHAQTLEEKLSKAVQLLERDSQMRHAILGFAVVDAKTGTVVFERNAQVGLAPASTQKIITSATAFELLGNNYRYATSLSYSGVIRNGVLQGTLIVEGSGDPTLGSWRYAGTKDSIILKHWVNAVRKLGIKRITEGVRIVSYGNVSEIPDGWIWQDIGNYYGAGAYMSNWKENQYDLILQSGDAVNKQVKIVSSGSRLLQKTGYHNSLRSAGKGTGDNAYIYLPLPVSNQPVVTGTIPVGEKAFSISGAMPDPGAELVYDLYTALTAASIRVEGFDAKQWNVIFGYNLSSKPIDTLLSPTLDSINYWFMRRSINLYGEALLKTIGASKTYHWSTDTGVRVLRNFWADKGIDKGALNIIDGSGLSPQNRITADALVQVLKYAKSRPWYNSLYASLPTYNGMKLKSGTIGGAKSFAGYHTSAQGKEYIVAIIVNNYAGSAGEIVKKMYKVLDELK